MANRLTDEMLMSFWRTVRPSWGQNGVMTDGADKVTPELREFAWKICLYSRIFEFNFTDEDLPDETILYIWKTIIPTSGQQDEMTYSDDMGISRITTELRVFAEIVYDWARVEDESLSEKSCSCTDCKCKTQDNDFINIKILKSICEECGINEENISNIDIEITELADRVPQEVTGSKYPNGILISVKE